MAAGTSDGRGAVAAPQPGVVGDASQVVRYQDVHDRAATYMSPRDLLEVQRAYVFCARAHEGQSRLSGEPYLVHPLAVAAILAGWRLDPVTVVSGLLHDVLEDTATTPEELGRLFGPDVTHVVDGVTKLSKLAFSTKEEVQAESFRKMILAMADDLRVVLVKLADRLHNMRTLGYLPREKQVAIAQETADIHAPIAHRLGMGRTKAELDDLAFRYLRPELYAALSAQLEQRRRADEDLIRELGRQLHDVLEKAGLTARIQGRRKSLASISRKMEARGIGIEDVHDTIAFRVLTGSVADCYAALGVLHATWTPVPGRFKDYIATPKPNGYRSLHLTLLAANGTTFEVQVRTEEMHLVAEEGVAAHWGYKEGAAPTRTEAARFAWLRALLEAQDAHEDPREFMAAVKMDLYGDEVYCFTPKGDVKVLPAGSTTLDFAYAIHTEVGHHCTGARIDGALVPLRTRLIHGNRVEILTSPSQHPSRDWLQVVATSRARSKIRQWFNLHDREVAVEEGRAALEREARKAGLSWRQASRSPELDGALKALGFRTLDDAFAAVGGARLQPAALLARLRPAAVPGAGEAPLLRPPPRGAARRAARSKSGRSPIVAGDGGLLVYLGRCCHPVKGDPILGYVTRGRGVAVHRQGCRSAASLAEESARLIPVSWDPEASATFEARLRVDVVDRPGMLAEVSSALSNLQANIRSASARTLSSRRGVVTLVIEVEDAEHLDRACKGIARLDGVRRVERG